MDTVASLIKRLGKPGPVAAELSRRTGRPLTAKAVYAWCDRGRIGQTWQIPVLDLARSEGVPLTAEQLLLLQQSEAA